MKPHEWRWRYFLLLFDCLIPFGCYFNIDVPSALQTDIQGVDTGSCVNFSRNATCCEECLGLGPDRYNRLYSAFSWMNAGFALPAGFFIDIIGNRVGGIVATSLACFGSVLFVSSSFSTIRGTGAMFPLMICGRLLIGAGTGSALIVQDRVLAFWFKDKISFAYGFVLMAIRVGNVANFFLTPNVAKTMGLTAGMWLGFFACCIGFLSSVALFFLDRHGTKQLDPESQINMKSVPFRIDDIKSLPTTYWLVCFMIVTCYSSFLPFIANGSKYIQDRYSYPKAESSYINGAAYDMVAFISPFAGLILAKINATGLSLLVTSLIMIPVFPLFSYCPSVHPVILTLWLGYCCAVGPMCLWPCILFVVPATKFGTACGIATFIQGGGVGLTNLAIGKILGFQEEPDIQLRIKKYQIMFLVLLGTSSVCFLLGVILNFVDFFGDRKINLRFKRPANPKELRNVAREKDPLLSDQPSIQSYASIDASEPTPMAPGIQ